MNHSAVSRFIALGLSLATSLHAGPPPATREPLLRAVDLNLGESAEITLSNGVKATAKLLDLQEQRDTLSHAVRVARVQVAINGESVWLTSANYNLPVTVAGVQVDCPITQGYNSDSGEDAWGLVKAARLRLWPAGSPLMEPGSFLYPLKQRWFATMTQMANEPTYVDGGDVPDRKKIYYHNALDFGGCESLVDVVAATDGLVVSVANQTLSGYEFTPVRPRYDVVYVLDERGWYYRYSHLHEIDPAIKEGVPVKKGQRIGVLGKEGASGGWSHLHFGIHSRQPSGKWGTQEAYAFAWEAWINEQHPSVIAVARPHHFIREGESITLDGSKSWCASGKPLRYDWTFTDGSTAKGATLSRHYDKAGSYSEILKVTDDAGHAAYDFAIVQVIGGSNPKLIPSTIHPSYAPSLNVKAGDAITFKVRSFRDSGDETWDFGDHSPPVTVKSDGNAKALAKDGYAITQHTFTEPGDHIVRVEHTNARGEKATAHLWVPVGKK